MRNLIHKIHKILFIQNSNSSFPIFPDFRDFHRIISKNSEHWLFHLISFKKLERWAMHFYPIFLTHWMPKASINSVKYFFKLDRNKESIIQNKKWMNIRFYWTWNPIEKAQDGIKIDFKEWIKLKNGRFFENHFLLISINGWINRLEWIKWLRRLYFSLDRSHCTFQWLLSSKMHNFWCLENIIKSELF